MIKPHHILLLLTAILAMQIVDGTYVADVHVALVDSTWYMWLSVDPLADKNPGVSPYIYCNGNPVMLIDPDGRDIYNFGNYLWGAGASALGISYPIVWLGSNINNFLYDTSSKWHLDSKDDQLSIKQGFIWQQHRK